MSSLVQEISLFTLAKSIILFKKYGLDHNNA